MTDAASERVLIAGFGNVLRGDDGFGAAVIAALEEEGALPDHSRTVDVGIGGFELGRELLEGYGALIIVDAVDRGEAPGTLYVLGVTVPPIEELSPSMRHALAVDMHAAVPDKVLVAAAAAGVLPTRICLVGCQPSRTDEFCTELTEPVRRAVPRAVARVRTLAAEWPQDGIHHG